MKLHRVALVSFTLTLLLVGLAVVTNVVPYRQIVEQNRQVAEAAAELAALREENALLAARRDALKTPVEIERLAREKLGYVRPGEIAYVVLDPPGTEDAEPEDIPQPEPIDDLTWVDRVWDFLTGADLDD